MRFQIRSDTPLVLVFEPVAEEYRLQPPEVVTIDWPHKYPDIELTLKDGELQIWTPLQALRAWDSKGNIIYADEDWVPKG